MFVLSLEWARLCSLCFDGPDGAGTASDAASDSMDDFLAAENVYRLFRYTKSFSERLLSLMHSATALRWKGGLEAGGVGVQATVGHGGPVAGEQLSFAPEQCLGVGDLEGLLVVAVLR